MLGRGRGVVTFKARCVWTATAGLVGLRPEQARHFQRPRICPGASRTKPLVEGPSPLPEPPRPCWVLPTGASCPGAGEGELCSARSWPSRELGRGAKCGQGLGTETSGQRKGDRQDVGHSVRREEEERGAGEQDTGTLKGKWSFPRELQPARRAGCGPGSPPAATHQVALSHRLRSPPAIWRYELAFLPRSAVSSTASSCVLCRLHFKMANPALGRGPDLPPSVSTSRACCRAEANVLSQEWGSGGGEALPAGSFRSPSGMATLTS